jgi:uncharacterized membrane protein (UPF0182 family)
MALLALGIALTFAISIWRRNFLLPLRGLGIFAIAWILLGVISPWFVQQFIVNPNELVKEKPYIAHPGTDVSVLSHEQSRGILQSRRPLEFPHANL